MSDAADRRDDLALRYAAGEDTRPLLGALGGGIAGALLMLAVDRLVPSPVPNDLLWPALVSAALPFGSTASAAAVLVAAAAFGALVFTYGQFRRFVPGPPWVAGVAWAIVAAAVVGPALLPRAAPWLSGSADGDPAAAMAMASVVVLEVVLGLVAYGVCVGVLNPRRS